MAYFEVSILARDEKQEPKPQQSTNNSNAGQGASRNNGAGGGHIIQLLEPQEQEQQRQTPAACVAVGLSMKGYRSSVRMPGWDSYSYGYHGDDGGIFHSKGDMIRVYGPTYNVGDTVGCGVNYQTGGIFFTLNGNFLGYAWCDEKVVMDGRVDLYP
eukprot:945976_1